MPHPSRSDSVRRRLGGYLEVAAPAALAPAVEAHWSYRAPAERRAPPHRVLPSNGASVCLQWTGGRIGAGDVQILAMGPVATPRVFGPDPGDGMEAWVIAPEWTRALLGPPAADLDDAIVDLADVVGPEVGRVRDQAVRERGARPLLAWLEDRRHRAHDPQAALVGAVLDRALGRRGSPATALRRVATELGVSDRHARRLVRGVAGASAKRLQRVHRLNRVVEAADGSECPQWASLAAAHGFYDQPHLIQEFRDLTGHTPVEVHRERCEEHVRFLQDEPAAAP